MKPSEWLWEKTWQENRRREAAARTVTGGMTAMITNAVADAMGVDRPHPPFAPISTDMMRERLLRDRALRARVRRLELAVWRATGFTLDQAYMAGHRYKYGAMGYDYDNDDD